MLRKTENINLVFLWILGAMLLFHGVIPHHHHFDSVFEHTSQPAQGEDNPSHCHAFNNLIPEKVTSSEVKTPLIFTSFIADCNLFIEEPFFKALKTYIVIPKVLNNRFAEHSPTRGSPFLS